ncbi:MAG: MBL fold metallo-hydrolase [Novosphingobium pentaromativorans]|uniref:MBL fold metallo-hydrolase n=1 Tax=Novosphingobium pentaromativorans TaxID=205844 RepID=A0A2W5NNS6_9SPHN|nr:MBL fold metallo-hydrolase [Novosphingobium panipatense]PZQ55056.1 MAG: MBL fold metallo-hydrolase [Novosphingobium pentaromativorans]
MTETSQQPQEQAQQPMRVGIIPVTPLQQNCSLIWCTRTMRGAFVDPGGDLPKLRQALEKTGVTLEKILVTHGHLDHCGLAGVFAEEMGVPIEGPQKEDSFWIDKLDDDGPRWNMEAHSFEPSRWLKDGDTVTVGELALDVVHCPGHTPGHIVFHHAPSKFAMVGDVLFKGGIGRWDFPRGNLEDLVDSITRKLWPLGDDVTFVPGHGPISTFGDERRSNPYVGDAALERGLPG